jgi:hypothetical protein
MNFVSTFLSHSSVDKTLVEAVAVRLGQHGVLAWFDKNELREMGPLDVALKNAVQQHATLTLFLSEASLHSDWCRDELIWALEAREGHDHILPVYLGDRLSLVNKHELLRNRFPHPDRNRVNQGGYSCEQYPTDANPEAIAEMIAATAYCRSIPETWSEAIIILDQRGNGARRGVPEIPPNIKRLDAPTLTFRPSMGERQPRETLINDDWEIVSNTLEQSLSSALSTLRGDIRKVRVLGNAQTSLFWAVGRHFDRTTDVDLYGHGRDNVVTNKGQERRSPLPGGTVRYNLESGPGGSQVQVALGIGSRENYLRTVQQEVRGMPLYWIESGHINNSEQAMQLVADIVASISHLRQNHGVEELVLFWTTANHVALLAAANLTIHVIPKIKFMEWDHTNARYWHLPMP